MTRPKNPPPNEEENAAPDSPDATDAPRRKAGRPPRADAPIIDYAAVDHLLVFGEVVKAERGPGTAIKYPSFRELAERFGVSSTLLHAYASSHGCMKRRAQNEARIQAKADAKLVEMRAETIALSKQDELRIIDSYLAKFEEALNEGRVRFDSPADFNTMSRLKQFLQGGADGRQEVRVGLTLEEIQERYRKAQEVAKASPQERGEVLRALPPAALVAPEAADPPLAAFGAATPQMNAFEASFAGISGDGTTPDHFSFNSSGPAAAGSASSTAVLEMDAVQTPFNSTGTAGPRAGLDRAENEPNPALHRPRWPTALALADQPPSVAAALSGMRPPRDPRPPAPPIPTGETDEEKR